MHVGYGLKPGAAVVAKERPKYELRQQLSELKQTILEN